jgi:hypothetical protein
MNPEIVDAIEYDESQVDVESIMQQIREYLGRQSGKPARGAGRGDFLLWPRGGAGSARNVLDSEVYDELYHANQTFDKSYVSLYLTPVRIPLLSALWQSVRARIHGLVLFYVNRLGETQIRFNSHVVRVLNAMVRDIDEDETPDQVAALEAKIVRLERTVQELEARLATLEGRAAPAAMGPVPGQEIR